MERFTIKTDDGSTYTVYLRLEADKAIYSVRINKVLVRFEASENWDTVEPFLIAVNPPADIDQTLLEEIAEKIDNYNL